MSNQTSNQVCCPKCDEPMSIISYDKAFDWDGNPQTFEYKAYRCSTCFDYVIDQHGEKVIPPIPTGYLIYGERMKCSCCGMYLKASPGTSIFYNDIGDARHVPYFGAKCFLCGRLFGRECSSRDSSKNQTFKELISIPKSVSEEWSVDIYDFLDSRCKEELYQQTFKFAYSPINKELIVFKEKQENYDNSENDNNTISEVEKIRINYEDAIEKYGSEAFENYILGRVFRDKIGSSKKILLKKHENINWMMETHFLLRRMGVTMETPLLWRNEEL